MKKTSLWVCLLLSCLSPFFTVLGEEYFSRYPDFESFGTRYEDYEDYEEKPAYFLYPGEEAFLYGVDEALHPENDGRAMLWSYPFDEGRFIIEGEVIYCIKGGFAYPVSYLPTIKKLHIPAKVEGVPVRMPVFFNPGPQVEELVIDHGVRGMYCLEFFNCTSLKKVAIYADIGALEDYELMEEYENHYHIIYIAQCPRLESFEIIGSIRTMGTADTITDYRSAYVEFLLCPKLKTVALPGYVNAHIYLSGVEALETFTLHHQKEDGTTGIIHKIGEGIHYNDFYGENTLSYYAPWKKETSFTLPQRAIKVSADAFKDNPYLETLIVPAHVEEIALGENQLKSIEVDPANPYYQSIYGVLYNKAGDTLVAFPGRGYFSYTVPEGVTKVKEFYSDTVTHLTFAEEMEILPDFDSFQAPQVETLSLPSTIKKVESLCSLSLPQLKDLQVSKEYNPFTMVDGLLLKDDHSLAYCPAYTTGRRTLPDSVSKIDPLALSQAVNLEILVAPKVPNEECVLVEIPPNLTLLANGKTYQAAYLEEPLYSEDGTILLSYPKEREASFFEVPVGVTTIGSYAFYQNPYIEKVNLPYTVTTIEQGAFSHCERLETLSLPPALQTIEERAFFHCYQLKKLVIPPSVTALPSEAFGFHENSELDLHPLNRHDDFYAKEEQVYASQLILWIPPTVTEIDKSCLWGRRPEELLLMVEEGSAAHLLAQNEDRSFQLISPTGEILKEVQHAVLIASKEKTVPLYKEKTGKESIGSLPIGSIVEVLSSQKGERVLCALEDGEGFYVEQEQLLLLLKEREFLSWGEKKKNKILYPYPEKSVSLREFPLYGVPRETGEVLTTIPQYTPVEIIKRVGPWYRVKVEGTEGYTLCQTLYPLDEEDLWLEEDYRLGMILPTEGKMEIPVYQYPDLKAPIVSTLLTGDGFLMPYIGAKWVKVPEGYVTRDQVQVLDRFSYPNF
ncbi:MAG: leucine-rich repeat protein [Clostridiales bacterium]|nr:leucine-rich repeat protein [Clostridiales bacterium]